MLMRPMRPTSLQLYEPTGPTLDARLFPDHFKIKHTLHHRVFIATYTGYLKTKPCCYLIEQFSENDGEVIENIAGQRQIIRMLKCGHFGTYSRRSLVIQTTKKNPNNLERGKGVKRAASAAAEGNTAMRFLFARSRARAVRGYIAVI